MRKMFTRLFSLALLLLLFSAISEVNAQNHCGPTIADVDVEVVTDLTTVCDGDQVTFQVVGYAGAEFAFNYDGDEVGGFTTDSAFTVTEGDPFRVLVRVNDTCYSNDLTVETNVIEPITILPATAEHPTCGDSLGEITVNFTGGVADFTYWIVPIDSFGTGTGDFDIDDYDTPTANNSAKPGTYVVTVQDQNMCYDIDVNANWDTVTVNLTSPAVVVDGMTGVDPVCYMGTTTVTADVSGGTTSGTSGLYVELRDAGTDAVVDYDTVASPGVASFDEIVAGSYYTYVKDSTGCEFSSDTTLVLEAPEKVEFEIEITDVSCAEAGNGAIQVAITNYVAGAEYAAYVESADSVYAWVVNDGDSIINITGLDPVYYALYVKDSSNICAPVAYVNPNGSGNKITVQSPGEIMFTVIADSIGCNGDSTLVTLDSVSGGNGSGLVFNLNGGDWLAVDTAEWLVPAGSYTVVGKNSDGEGCGIPEAFTIAEAGAFAITSVDEILPSCPGGNDGLVTINVEGGSGNYVFSIDSITWYEKNNFTTKADTFKVYAKDLNCENSLRESMAYVRALDKNEIEMVWINGHDVAVTDTAITCNGDSTAFVRVKIASWGLRPDEDRSATVYITTDESAVYVPGNDTLELYTVHGSDYFVAEDLGAGTYYIWAGDNLGCESEDYLTVVVTQPEVLEVVATVTEHATCNNDNDGVITAKGIGGNADDYYYGVANTYLAAVNMSIGAMTEWPADTVVEIQAAAGEYFVVLLDSTCGTRDISQELVVESFDPVVIADTALVITDIVCAGDSAGAFTIAAATGGSGDLAYTLWTDGDTVAGYVEVYDTVFTNLKGGSYTVEVTDMGVGGCDGATTGDITVDEPKALQFNVMPINISCTGASDGVAMIHAWGGNEGQYMFKLDNNSWQPMIDGEKNVVIIEPGTYTVTVRDTFECVGRIDTFEIEEPDPIVTDIVLSHDTTACNGDDEGAIWITATGGWAEEYDFEIMHLVDSTEYSQYGDTVLFDELAAGDWKVTVTESVEGPFANPCVLEEIVTIQIPDTITADVVVTEDVACKDGETGVITVSNIMGGNEEYTLAISPVVGTQDSNVFSELPAGMYVITVMDTDGEDGCSTTLDTVVVAEPAEYLTMGATKIQDITCAEDGKFSIQAEGGVGEYKYYAAISILPDHVLLPGPDSSAWVSDSIFSVDSAGTWIVWVMDENGCIVGGEEDEDGIPVNEWRVPVNKPVVEVIVDLDDQEVKCNGDMTAMIVVTADDVTITVDGEEDDYGYTILYTNLAGDELGVGDTLATLGADTVIVTVTDTLTGCSGVDTVAITQPEVLDVMLTLMDGEFACPNDVTGYIEAIATGGAVVAKEATMEALKSASVDVFDAHGYTYQLWQDGSLKTDYQPDNSFFVTVGMEYQVVVMDYNGCTDTSNVVPIDPVAPVVVVDVMDITCSADTAASVKVTVVGEEGRMFKVVWRQYEAESDDHFGETEWMPAGDIILDQTFKFDNESDDDQHYEIYVEDNKGCKSDKDSMTFDQVITTPLELTVAEGVVSGCGTEVTITAAGGVAPYVIMIDDVEVTEDMVVLGGGMHTIKVMDMHECSVEQEITLDYPMSSDTAIVTYTDEAVQFVVEEAMLDTMLYVGEYSFYYNVDDACVAELNVTVTEIDRSQPEVTAVSPTDTLEDNHPTFVITFDGPVTFNDSVMGYLVVTPKDSSDYELEIAITSDMVDEANGTITVDYTLAEGQLGLDKNTTYVVAVDSGIVVGDGLAWDGSTTEPWMFTTGEDFALGIIPGFEQDDFKVYPNPFNDYIKVDNYDKLSRVVITNIAGQRVLDIEYPSYEIRTGNLVTGVYVVTLIKDNSIVKSERIIKR